MSEIDRTIQLDQDLKELKRKKSIYERFAKKEDVIGALIDLLDIYNEKYSRALRHSVNEDKDPQYKIMLNFIEHIKSYIEEAPQRLIEVEEILTNADTGDLLEDWSRDYFPLFGNLRKKKEQEQLEKKLQKALYSFKYDPSSVLETPALKGGVNAKT